MITRIAWESEHFADKSAMCRQIATVFAQNLQLMHLTVCSDSDTLITLVLAKILEKYTGVNNESVEEIDRIRFLQIFGCDFSGGIGDWAAGHGGKSQDFKQPGSC
jgi:hypothetical protein